MSKGCFGKPRLVARCTTCEERAACHERDAEVHPVFLLPEARRVPDRPPLKAVKFLKEKRDVR